MTKIGPVEYKVVSLRQCPMPDAGNLCDTPASCAEYWKLHVATDAHYDPERECVIVLMLNARCKVKGHHFLSHGSADSVVIHPRDVFRCAIIAAAVSIVLMHNHPSGATAPSETDGKITRDLKRAGDLLKMPLADHIIVGDNGAFTSLRERGYVY